MDNEVAKLIVTSVTSFASALLAAIIAIYTSTKSRKNSIDILRQTSFSMVVAESYQKVIQIIVKALQEKRVLNPYEQILISERTIWMSDEIVQIAAKLVNDKEYEDFCCNANNLINEIRKVIGVKDS